MKTLSEHRYWVIVVGSELRDPIHHGPVKVVELQAAFHSNCYSEACVDSDGSAYSLG